MNLDEHLKKTRKKRIELSNKILGVIAGIVKRSDNREARDIHAFLEGSTIYGEPVYKEDKGPGVLRHSEDGEDAKTAVVFLLKEDNDLGQYIDRIMNSGETHSNVGKYLEEWRTIFLDTSKPISDIWLALMFLHEGAHGFHHLEGRYRSDEKGFFDEERDVLKMEISIARELGGEEYEEVVNGHLTELRKVTDINKDEIKKIVRPREYPKLLDEAFGKAKSELEKEIRSTTVFYDALFKHIEEIYSEESMESQSLFLKQQADNLN